MREVLQVFEHQRLRVGEHGFAKADFEALVRFNQRHQDEFFVVGHQSLKFTSYVGVLRVGGLTIEVLPKADRAGTNDKTKWRNALIDMLRACGYLKLAAVSAANLRVRRTSLFDLYMEAFLIHVQELLHHGLVKKYRPVNGNVTALKGRLLFSRQLAENLIHRERFFTAHQQYDWNNKFNQILRLAVSIVAASARSSTVRGAADGLLVWMEGINEVSVTSETFQRLRYDRNTERYRPAMALAQLIVLNYQPDIRAGGHDVLAILFDMNELFEEYVLRQLKRAAALSDGSVKVEGQQGQRFWRAGGTTRRIRPDILVKLPQGPTGSEIVVLDTKWKVPVGSHPEDSDLKQMYAYNLQFGAARSFLLYPWVDRRNDVRGHFQAPAHDAALQHECGMWFINLFEASGGLKRDLGTVILKGLLSETDRPA